MSKDMEINVSISPFEMQWLARHGTLPLFSIPVASDTAEAKLRDAVVEAMVVAYIEGVVAGRDCDEGFPYCIKCPLMPSCAAQPSDFICPYDKPFDTAKAEWDEFEKKYGKIQPVAQ